jgi:hypothetical protein
LSAVRNGTSRTIPVDVGLGSPRVKEELSEAIEGVFVGNRLQSSFCHADNMGPCFSTSGKARVTHQTVQLSSNVDRFRLRPLAGNPGNVGGKTASRIRIAR